MDIATVKTNLATMIDREDNLELLLAIQDLLENNRAEEDGIFWKSLTDAQQLEVLRSFEETKDQSKWHLWGNVKRYK